MRKSVLSKILFVSIALVLMTVPIVTILVFDLIQNIVHKTEKDLVNSIIDTTINLIEVSMTTVHEEKESRILEIHKKLGNFANFILPLLEKYTEELKGILTKSIFIENLSILVLDRKENIYLQGDIKDIPKEVLEKSLNRMKTKESLFVRLNDPVSPKILYLKKLPKDDKIIAFIYPLSGLEEEFNKRAYQTLRKLRGKISEISIQERGYIVIVSGDSDYFLIHPVKGWEGSMVPPEPQTGRDLKKIIRETAIRGENNFFEYLWYSPDFKKVERKISFVKLYKPLNWYVLGTIYEEDLRNRVKKANMLAGLLVGTGSLAALSITFLLTRRLREKMENLKTTWETIQVGIALCEKEDLKIKDMNSALARMLGKDKNEIKGESLINLVYPEDRDLISQYITKIQKGISGDLQVKLTRDDGEILHVIVRGNNLEERGYFLLSFTDITKIMELQFELERANEALQKLSSRDHLTGAFNRRSLEKDLEEMLERAKIEGENLSLIMFDIDRFKKINDLNGHLVGDCVLKILVKLISFNLRPEDNIYRYGGEEFIILLPGTSKENAIKVAQRLRVMIENHNFCYRGYIEKDIPTLYPQITCSFGVASFPDDGNSPEKLLLKVDQALYKAKKNGRNRVETA